MISGINESNILTTHISCKCKCKFDKRKCYSDQERHNDICQCECKKIRYMKKISFGIVLHVVAKMVKYLVSILMMIQ